MGVVIEIRRARSDRNAAKFYGYPYFTSFFFCAHLRIIMLPVGYNDII